MMYPFFLIILLVLPWVHPTVNNTGGLGNSTSGLDTAIKPRQDSFQCYLCAATNTFNCPRERVCPDNDRRCAVIAILVCFQRQLRDWTCPLGFTLPTSTTGNLIIPLTNGNCHMRPRQKWPNAYIFHGSPHELMELMEVCDGMNSRELLVYKNCVDECSFVLIQPPPTPRKLPQTTYFYYTMCCSGHLCNEGGPSNIERDLSPPVVIEEGVIARAVCLGEFNFLLNLSLILSSSILT